MARNKPNKKILDRLKRAEGQVKAVRKMYEQNEGCFSITQQIAAAKSALEKVAVLLLEEESEKCLKQADKKRLSDVIKNLIKMS